VLLDEDLPIRLRLHFPQTTKVETVKYRGWKGYKNGELLRAAEDHFDVFVTMDDHLPDQQALQHFGRQW
jgi:predicted nuclease of predicted toxin-antitoxin system